MEEVAADLVPETLAGYGLEAVGLMTLDATPDGVK
jgi:hypothetical protein